MYGLSGTGLVVQDRLKGTRLRVQDFGHTINSTECKSTRLGVISYVNGSG